MTDAGDRYPVAERFLHWGTAALFLGLVALGWWMVRLSYYHPSYHSALEWHKGLGVWVFFLAAVRLVWRLAAGWRNPPNFSLWERWLARLVHALLLSLTLLIPLSGYFISTAAGDSIALGVGLQFPALVEVSAALRDFATAAHYWLAYGLLALVAVHVAAVAKHHWLDKVNLLRRMI